MVFVEEFAVANMNPAILSDGKRVLPPGNAHMDHKVPLYLVFDKKLHFFSNFDNRTQLFTKIYVQF